MTHQDSPARSQNPLGLIPLGELRHYLPTRNGKLFSKATTYRWAQVGVGPRRIRLRVVVLGGAMCTRLEWLEAFMERLSEARSKPDPVLSTASDPAQTADARAQRTKSILERHGMRRSKAGDGG